MKIVPLGDLQNAGGVLCHGCFDVLHVGHLRYLTAAAALGKLIVTVTADEFVNKGPGRPWNSDRDRAELLAGLACVDKVAINYSPTEINVIEMVRPAIYCKGSEYRAGNDVLDQARKALWAYGGMLVYLDDENKRYSSTEIIRKMGEQLDNVAGGFDYR